MSSNDSRELLRLPPGIAYVCNPAWGAVKVAIRPPLSKVWQPSDHEIANLVGPSIPTGLSMSAEAQAILDQARVLQRETGNPTKLKDVANRVGVTSRRRLAAITKELEQTGAARFGRLAERGKPVIVIPLNALRARTNRA